MADKPLLNAASDDYGSVRLDLKEKGAQGDITFSDVCLDVIDSNTKEPKRILTNVSGFVKPGQVLAIMGASGSGKTSLLNLLTGRSFPSSGSVLLEGQEISARLKRKIGFVTQQDLLFPLLTVRETLMYSAHLRLPETVSDHDRSELVDRILSELNLSDIANSRVGDTMVRGISGGEKKRVSIGVELVALPSVLALDEPTSGLDSSTAYQVMKLLRNLASGSGSDITSQPRTVICTLHQPRYNIFALFDQLMLLSGGHVVYFGPASEAVGYFAKYGFICPPYANPADFLIDVCTSCDFDPITRQLKLKNQIEGLQFVKKDQVDCEKAEEPLVQVAERSVVAATVSRPLSRVGENVQQALLEFSRQEASELGSDPDNVKYPSSFCSQLWQLTTRAMKNELRNPISSYVAFFRTLTMALLVGFLYFKVTLGQEGIQDRVGALYFILINQAFGSMASLRTFLSETEIFTNEKRAESYRTSTYFLAKTLSELPLLFILPITFCSVSYWMVGFQDGAEQFAVFLLTVLMITLVASSYIVCLGSAVQDDKTSAVLAPVVLTLFLLFGGFFVNIDSIPKVLSWIQYVSFFKYAFRALVINEFSGLKFTCTTDERISYKCPEDPTKICFSCPVPDGNTQIQRLHMDCATCSVWYDIMILFLMTIVFRVLGYLALRSKNRPPSKIKKD